MNNVINMSELKIIALTNVNMENLSRKDLLNWVNSLMEIQGNNDLQIKKIEDLCNGVAYCLIMEQIFPKSIGLGRIKTSPKLEHDFLHNLRLLQNAFINLKFDKSVPMDKLIKGRFQDNFEFLQWFKKFYDTVSNNENSLNAANAMPKLTKVLRKTNSKSNLGARKESCLQTRSASHGSLKVDMKTRRENHEVTQHQTNGLVSPDSLKVIKKNIEVAQYQIDGLTQERDFYHNKLISIEALLKKSLEKEDKVDFCKRTLKVINATDNGSEECASTCSTE